MSDATQRTQPEHEEISRLAYALWQFDGYVHGKDRQHWLLAEEMLSRGETLPEVNETSLGDVAEIRRRLSTEVTNDLGGDSHQWAADHGSQCDERVGAARSES